ncbi:MAG: hypothetical protein ACI9SJ_000297 [Flavobacteriaceae bacterium]|jgi:hypothetical protein|uniref:DUF6503 family protein n=1 Tax=Candidatus Marifrigoribacter sp. Uisw_064 TaxID=3230970 RepID=UPI003AC7DBE5
MKYFFFLLILTLSFSCKQEKKVESAQNIIDMAINKACNEYCENAIIDFTFRDRCYVSTRKEAYYKFERITNDSTGVTRDILSNKGFQRFKNDTLLTVVDSMAVKYGNSVNSVHYFAQLPYGLNDAAVIKEMLGESTINNEPYYEIGVHFKKEGGGTDYDDTFVYWIHKENYTVDYLAYQYSVNGGGIRFREAYNVRIIEGIRFVDYNNYKPESLETPLTNLDELFQKGKLKLLSKIENESIGVSY